MSDEPPPSWSRVLSSWHIRTAALLLFGMSLVAFVVLHYEWSNRDRDTINYLTRTNHWIASQLELELIRFLSTVDRFALEATEVEHDEVTLRFDLLWSRIPIFLNGPEAAAAREVEGAVDTVCQLLADLRDLEPVVRELAPGDRIRHDMIVDRLASYQAPLHKITLEVAIGNRRQELLARLATLDRRGFVLEIAIIGAGLILILFLLFETHKSRLRAEREHSLLRASTESSQAKSRFLANMSHELRTPLNAIIGFSELMTREHLGPLGAPTYREYIGDILTSGRHLLTILNDILDVARIESGTLRLTEEDFNTCEAVEACRQMLKPRAEEREVELTTLLDRPAPIMLGDARLFRQICLNLAGNAVKFSPSGSQVTVVCTVEEDGLRLIVEDNGPGIPPDELDKVVEPFHQCDAGLNRRNDGCGLGLALTKAFVELHGGGLEIESRVGFGTRVSACFPMERLVAYDSPAASAAGKSGASEGIQLDSGGL